MPWFKSKLAKLKAFKDWVAKTAEENYCFRLKQMPIIKKLLKNNKEIAEKIAPLEQFLSEVNQVNIVITGLVPNQVLLPNQVFQ